MRCGARSCRALVIIALSLIAYPCNGDLGGGTLGGMQLRTLLERIRKLVQPGRGQRAAATQEGSGVAVTRAFDHAVLHLSHKALGTKGSGGRGRGGGGGGGAGGGGIGVSGGGSGGGEVAHPLACDRSGGKCALCALTRGSWCEEYYRQDRVPWKPGPRGSKDCPATKWGPCNGVGNCHYDIGQCQCMAGFTGAACDQPSKRPCTNSHKNHQEPLNLTKSHVGPDGLDLDLSESGWTASRCAGMCDADRASCWCPPSTVFGRKPPPPDAPPWVRYSSKGRVIGEACKPGVVPKSGLMIENDWGHKTLSYDDIFGPKGWCNAASKDDMSQPAINHCSGHRACHDEGLHGVLCDRVSEETCLNQCSGHGDCDAGFCRCHPGWYGHDCARKKAGEQLEPGLEQSRPWLQNVVLPIPAAAAEPPQNAAAAGAGGGGGGPGGEAPQGRLRPLIYVYDMPPEFTSRMHQYKLTTSYCGYREFVEGNRTEVFSDSYSIEVYFHEMLSVSPHRTFDPEEADFFYVPVYYTCFMWPINGWADAPFWGPPTSWHRYANAAHMWLEAKRWLQSSFPYWDRRGGADHIWMTNHDEGACYMPTEIYKTSIMLTHWGRLEHNHTSNTAYTPDNYSQGCDWPGVLDGKDTMTLYEGHPCYDPQKDLVIPGFKTPGHFQRSPLLGSAPMERDILLYLRGDVGKHRLPNYSRGIRQKLHGLSEEHHWAEKHSIFIGEKYGIPGDYGDHLARSVFCAVVPGDGYAMRMEDAVLHGCLPLIIMDDTHVVFESIIDIDAFSLRIKQAALNEHLPYLLKAIAPEQIQRMQRRLALVWHRYAYAHGPLVAAELRQHVQHNLGTSHHDSEEVKEAMRSRHAQVPEWHPYQPVHSFPVHTDAFTTILQWLHSRIKDTRAPPAGSSSGGGIAGGVGVGVGAGGMARLAR